MSEEDSYDKCYRLAEQIVSTLMSECSPTEAGMAMSRVLAAVVIGGTGTVESQKLAIDKFAEFARDEVTRFAARQQKDERA